MSSGGAFKLIKSLTPYILKSLNSGLILCASDILSQMYVEKRNWHDIDKERTIKFTSIGILFTGPLLANWRYMMRKSFATNSIPAAIQKTLVTQIFLAPPLNFGIIALAEALKDSMPTKINIPDILQGDFVAVMGKNYMIWLPAQLTGYIIRYKIVKYGFKNFVSIIWFAYLSSILMTKPHL